MCVYDYNAQDYTKLNEVLFAPSFINKMLALAAIYSSEMMPLYVCSIQISDWSLIKNVSSCSGF